MVELHFKYRYDPDVDALYLEDGCYDFVYSIPVSSEVVLDFNGDDECVGVELLNCVESFGLDRVALLYSDEVCFYVQLDGSVLRLKLVFSGSRNDLVRFVARSFTYRISCVLPVGLRGCVWSKCLCWRG